MSGAPEPGAGSDAAGDLAADPALARTGARAADYGFALLIAALFLLLSSQALRYVERHAPPGQRSIGVVADTHLVYMSAIYGSFARESGVSAGAGGLLVHNHQTGEPHPATQARPWDWLIGKLSIGLGGGPDSAFTLDRYAAVIGFCLAFAFFLGELVRSRAVRWLALVAAVFGGSLNWVLVLAGRESWLYAQFGDWIGTVMGGLSGLGFAFPALLLGVPHLMLELVFLMAAFGCGLRAVRRDSLGWSAAAGVAAFFLCSVRPYTLPVALATLGVLFGVHWLRKPSAPSPGLEAGGGRRSRLRRFAMGVAALGPPLPLIAHYYQVVRGDTIFAGLDVHHPAPLFDEQLLFYGVPIFVAALLLIPAVRARRRRQGVADGHIWLLLGVWALANHAIVYGEAWPKPFQILWEVEAMLPLPLLALVLAALAADGLPRRWVLRLGVPLLALHVVPTGFWAAEIAERCERPLDSLFVSDGDAQALAWLEASVPPDALTLDAPPVVLLCDNFTARLVPWRAGVRVYLGHLDHARDPEPKLYRSQGFFATGRGLAELRADGVTHVLLGPRERRLRDASVPAQAFGEAASELELVFEARGSRLFALRPPD